MSRDHAREPELVSVIIPALNAAQTIGQQLDALTRQTYRGPWEVVLADNGSIDDTRTIASSYRRSLPSLMIVDASAVRGPAHARNSGVQASSGDFLAMCDADDEVDERWLFELVRVAATTDLVGGAIDRTSLNQGKPGRMRGTQHVEGLIRPFGIFTVAPTGNLGVWRETFDRLGGFDETLPAAEDIDFSWRAHAHGIPISFARDAVVRYRYRDGYIELLRQHFAYGRGIAHLLDRHDLESTPADLAGSPKEARWLLSRVPYIALGRKRRSIWLRKVARYLGYRSAVRSLHKSEERTSAVRLFR